jgi:hypothetical protein
MKKKIFHMILLFCSTIYDGSCQNMKEFNAFLNYFHTIELPYNTINLNSDKEIISITKGRKIESAYCVKFLYQGDDKKVQYPYIIYQMEEGSVIEKGLKDYNYYPIWKYHFQNHIGLVYFKSGMYEAKLYLSLFSKNGNQKDTLTLNQKIGDNEYYCIRASYIEKDKVIIFNYEANPEFLEKVKKITGEETIPRTIITISTYNIDDNTGTFELQKQEKKYSQCSVDEFASNEEKCKADNPMNMLLK